MDGLGQSVFTLGASLAAFILGNHLAAVLSAILPSGGQSRVNKSNTNGNAEKHRASGSVAGNGQPGKSKHAQQEQRQNRRPGDHSPRIRWHSDMLAIPLLLACYVAAIIVTVYRPAWRGIAMFALVFAPLGTCVRYYLSRLNPRLSYFPLGTFAANMLGTALLAGFYALQRTGDRSLLQCQILQGLDDGFCGCLTTVSTFVAEVRKLQRKHAYTYALSSWILGQILVLVVLGSVDFARGGLQPRCAVQGG